MSFRLGGGNIFLIFSGIHSLTYLFKLSSTHTSIQQALIVCPKCENITLDVKERGRRQKSLQETHSPVRESEDQTAAVQCGRCGDGVAHEDSLGTTEKGLISGEEGLLDLSMPGKGGFGYSR